ncbi:MAG: hypothetical protein IH949_12780 [Bacteroidetes bacterium]|nr:hypothetical protein [Bacteroidota bacterium]
METLRITLSISLFLLFYTVVLAQQSITVDIPGNDTFIFYDGNNGYGSGSNELKVGKNGNTYRSYITWSNILSYVPASSQVTNVEFYITWGGNGSTSAQIDFRDFIWTGNITQDYANIGSGTLWGTKVAVSK